jgi:XTP/dITP diphosphohydrolase
MKLVLATRNPGKVRELKELFKDIDVELVTIDEFESIPVVIEDGKSFRENALKKAKVIADSTGEFAIADDSGLEVEYLNGRPGIYSSRYAREGAADKENNEKLLSEMEGVCASERGASFCCVIALIGPGIEKTFKGTCCGSIAFEPKGEKGFGYDPIFYVPSINQTMAELDPEKKNSISHRAKAFDNLKKWLKEHIDEITSVN